MDVRDARVDATQGHGREAGQDLVSRPARAAQGFLFELRRAGRAIRRREPWVAQVEARFDAFIAYPVAIRAEDIGVGQADPRQDDAPIGLAGVISARQLRWTGAGVADEGDALGVRIDVVRLPRDPLGQIEVAFSLEVHGLAAGDLIVTSADQPGRWLELEITTPDAGPQWVAQGKPGPSRLRGVRDDVGAGGDPSVRAGFLLEMSQGEPEGHHGVESGAQLVLLVRGDPRFDGDERRQREQQQDHEGHHHQGQDEAEAGSLGGEGWAGGGSFHLAHDRLTRGLGKPPMKPASLGFPVAPITPMNHR